MKELQELSKALGLINGMIPVAFTLGSTLVKLIKGAAAGTTDQATKEEALAAVARFEAAAKQAGADIQAWLDTHPSTPE